MKRVILVFIVVALLLTGCNKKGFETDIDLSASKSQSGASTPASESATPNSPSATPESQIQEPETQTSETLNSSVILLPDTALSNQDMMDIYGIKWDTSAQDILEPILGETGAVMPEMSLYRACYLLQINPMQVTTFAGWYVNTNGSMILYFTFPAGNQSYMQTTLNKAAKDLKALLQPQFESEADKAKFDNIRVAVDATKAYFIIPDGWTGDTILFRQAYTLPNMTQLKEPPFPIEGLSESTPYVKLAADQLEYELVKAMGFKAKPELGQVSKDMSVDDYLAPPADESETEISDEEYIEDSDEDFTEDTETEN